MNEATEELMSEKEFLAKTKICRATLNKFKRQGKLGYYKVGRRVLYGPEHLREFKENCARRVEAHPTEGNRRG